MSSSRRIALGLAVAGLAALGFVLTFRSPGSAPPPVPPAPDATPAPAVPEVAREALELREGRLRLAATGELFTGILVERYTPTAVRARIEIHQGLAHGLALGWYDTGEPEVRESFVAGRSHGLRTRWYKNGRRRSEAEIRDGQLHGLFREWHEDGRLASELTLAATH